MKKKSYIFIIITIVVLLITAVYFIQRTNSIQKDNEMISFSEIMTDSESIGYSFADSVREFIFPEDHAAHNNYKLEWWYFTGNVMTNEGRHFGYQFTIFRYALKSGTSSVKSDFATNQLYFAHLALTDISENKHYGFEKFARGANGLAGSSANPLEIFIEDWNIKGEYLNNDYVNPKFHIKAQNNEISLNLKLNPSKGMVLHGNRGLSPKSNLPGIASYYYSFTRLNTKGEIGVKNKKYNVAGNSWFDREWSTTTLSKNQKGWDWFSVQLDDSTELMCFRLRDTAGKTDFARGTFVGTGSKYQALDGSSIKIFPLSTNKLNSGNIYPNKWKIEIPQEGIELYAETVIPEQEMKLSVKYYEGSIKVSGTVKDKKINGYGYVELTGYEN